MQEHCEKRTALFFPLATAKLGCAFFSPIIPISFFSPFFSRAWMAVLERIRDATDVPVIVISTQRQVAHRLRALQTQAQDYLTKPLDLREVVLRARSTLADHAAVLQSTSSVYDDGVLGIDAWKRVVSVHGPALALSYREQRILGMLIRVPGRLVTYREILEVVPSADAENPDTVLRSAVYRVRRKLALAASGHSYLLTQRDLGIRLNTR